MRTLYDEIVAHMTEAMECGLTDNDIDAAAKLAVVFEAEFSGRIRLFLERHCVKNITYID